MAGLSFWSDKLSLGEKRSTTFDDGGVSRSENAMLFSGQQLFSFFYHLLRFGSSKSEFGEDVEQMKESYGDCFLELLENKLSWLLRQDKTIIGLIMRCYGSGEKTE